MTVRVTIIVGKAAEGQRVVFAEQIERSCRVCGCGGQGGL